MNIETRAQALALQRLLGRAQQAGLVIDIGCLSRNHRRAALALGRLDTERQVIARHPIGFRYPNSR